MSIQNIAAFGIGLLLSQFLRTFKKASPYVGALMLLFGFICISFIHVLLLTVIGLIGIGIGLGTIVPIMNAQIARVTERSKAPAAMALMSAFLFLGQFLSPIIIDALVALLPVDSLRAPYYIAALLCGLFTVILIFIPIRVNGENK